MQRTLALSLVLAAVFPNPLQAETPPHIIFILFDDLGYGQPGCYRANTEFLTPHLNKLARDGMRFTDAHSAASVCTPTRYGVLTGRYPARIGQYGVLTTYSPPIIPQSRLTVASFLRQNNYDTACIGKWHLGMLWKGKPGTEKNIPVGTSLLESPNSAGFDYFYGYTHARNLGTLIEQNRVVENVEEQETQPQLAKKIVEYLSEPARKQKPFFLYLPLCPPHTPIVPSADFLGKGGAAGPYGDWLSQGDWVLGQVLETLDRQNLANNTLILVSSDNGASGRNYEPLRGSKTSIYEGGHRVPFLARWPGKIPAGTLCHDTICLNDLLATSAEIVGKKLPENAGEDSVSILPDLLGTATSPVREATLHQAPNQDLALRQDRWKLILKKNGTRELYDLKQDLGETQNVLKENPEIAQRLEALLKQYDTNGRSTPGPRQNNEVPLVSR